MQTHVPDKLEFLGSTSLFQSFPQAFWTTAGMNILIILCIFGSGHFYLFITVCLIYCTNTLIFATDNYFFSQCSNALLGRCPFFVNESKFTKLYFCNFSTVVRHCAMLSNVENISIYIYTSCSYLFQKVRDMPLDDVVILDIDKNTIELPFNDVDNLPSEAVSKFF